jgi:PAS domain S-box-containing protein
MFGFASFAEMVDHPMITFYGRMEDRRSFLDAVIENGRVVEFPLSLKRRDDSPLWCSVTARTTLERSGLMVHLDGVMRDITKEMKTEARFDVMENSLNDFVVLLDKEGDLLDINRSGTELLGFKREYLVGKPITEFIVPRFRDLFSTFISIILKTGREEGVMTIMDRNGNEKHLEFHAIAEKRVGGSEHIQLMARNVTERIKYQKEQLSKEKFLGVLEMAGGVAHKLNQPLTIIRNMVSEVLSHTNSSDPNYEKIIKINQQIERINELAKKIVKIKKYEPMDYVAGVKIVNIDKTT